MQALDFFSHNNLLVILDLIGEMLNQSSEPFQPFFSLQTYVKSWVNIFDNLIDILLTLQFCNLCWISLDDELGSHHVSSTFQVVQLMSHVP